MPLDDQAFTVKGSFAWLRQSSAGFRGRWVWRSVAAKGHALSFSTGQVVVHPHHGPATVKKIFTRVIRNERKRYLRLAVHHDELLSVAVPLDAAEEIGVRATVDVVEVREIFAELLAESSPYEKVWSRRIKADTERLRSGRIGTIAGLIRDLTRRNEEKRLAFGEMKLLRDATGPFVAELALVLALTEEKVAAMVHAAILEGTKPELPDHELAAAS